ncbi:MAG: AsmA family protein, partial [Parvibaculum sp.]|nr:AsmA family protein [Parvibaculum sp.]
MNSILTYIAGLLVVLLFAALVGPSLVDWNQFREEIEAQASEAAGRPVSIDGDIRFRILPAPHLTLGKIKVGQNPEADSLPSDLNFATFAEIDG